MLGGTGVRVSIRRPAGVGLLVLAIASLFACGNTSTNNCFGLDGAEISCSIDQDRDDVTGDPVKITLTKAPPGSLTTRIPVPDGLRPSVSTQNCGSEWDSGYAIETFKNTLYLNISVLEHTILNFDRMNINVLERGPAIAGTRIDCAGGELYTVEAIVDLSASPPSVEYAISHEDSDGNSTAKTVKSLKLALKKGDDLALIITASPSDDEYVKWTGSVDVFVDGKKMIVPLSEHRVTGSGDSAFRRSFYNESNSWREVPPSQSLERRAS